MTVAPPLPGPPTVRTTFVVVALLLATLGTALPLSMVAPTLAVTADQFSTTTADSSWMLTIVLVVAAATTPFIGRLGDVYGQRRVLLSLLPIVAAGLLLTATADTLVTAIAGRALQGLGGGVFPLAISIADAVVPPRRRAAVVGALAGTFGTGTGLGVVIAGVLVDRLGTHALAWIPFVLVLAAETIALFALPRIPRTDQPPRLRAASALLLVGGVTAVLLAVTESRRMPHPLLTAIVCAAVGALLLALWAWREHIHPDALIGSTPFRSRATGASHLAAFLLGATLFALLVVVPVYTELGGVALRTEDSTTVAGVLLLPATAAMAAVGPLAGLLRRTLGRGTPVVLGTGVATAGALIMLIAPHTLVALLAGSTIAGAGIAIGSAGTLNVLLDVVPDGDTAVAGSVHLVARQLGGALGAAIAAALLSIDGPQPDSLGYTLAFGSVALLAACALGSSLLIPRTRDPGSPCRRRDSVSG